MRRPINFFHVAIPTDRIDAAFYKPLQLLKLPRGTELNLGLIRTDDDKRNCKRLDVA